MIKDESKYFYVCDGSVLRSMAEFKVALKKMPKEVYDYHAERGDWSSWVSGVLKKAAVAKKLSSAKTRASAIKAVGA